MKPLLFALALAGLAATSPSVLAETEKPPLDLKVPAKAVALVEKQARKPGGLSAFAASDLQDLVYAAAKDKPGLQLRLLNLLARENFAPADPFETYDDIWYEQALRLAEKGDQAGALTALGRMRAINELFYARLDPVFAPARAADPAVFDIKAAVERRLAQAETLSAAHPDRLAGARIRADALEQLGRADQALALVDEALAKVEAHPGDYVDKANTLVSLHVERAVSLWLVGRADDAIAERRRTIPLARSQEDYDGWADLALIGDLVLSGKAAEALTALDYFNAEVGAAGIDNWVAARAICANAQLGRQGAAQRELKHLAGKDAPNTASLSFAYLCLNDLDKAALTYIARLENPDRAPRAIEALSPRVAIKAARPAMEAELLRRQALVAARPDVAAALAKRGGPQPSPLIPAAGEPY
ncbi:hypothetical protein PMI01_02644 [Caulobacter sp. AP07]|uniref:hypothetical protein n=1 Tax=Caulobacter sp. AP07 TaxID=1144304 RepID=UPI0002720C05|nr:hypothetical protein [Caulobacter sp. AP07]EJL32069.1 hypothetical protein PMI01_02644 [Caulobacter sp. AP07]